MSKEKITIHRALSELKIIDSRIEKAISNIKPCGYLQKDKLVDRFYDKKDFDKDAKADFDSVVGLIDRKNKIKSAIVKANGATKVTIGGKKMTIADAISFRAVILLKKDFIASLTSKLNKAKEFIEKSNVSVDENALRLAEAAYGKDNVKVGDKDYDHITKPYIENNKFSLVDPLGVEKLVETLQEEVDNFETEVDATLSEINAITFIDI